MKHIVIYLLVISVSGLLSGCSTSDHLDQALHGDQAENRCEAIMQLGGSTSDDHTEVLVSLLSDEDPHIRKCTLIALNQHSEKPLCEKNHQLWLKDSDEQVRRTGGILFLENGCEQDFMRTAEYEMDSKTCGYTQFFVNSFRDRITRHQGEGDWKSTLSAVDIKKTITDPDTPEEIIDMRLNLVFATMDWGDAVAVLKMKNDLGSDELNQKGYIDLRENYSIRQEFLMQFCPKLMFPPYSYWLEMLKE